MDVSFNSEGGIERARKRRRSNEITGEKEINIQVVVHCRYVLIIIFVFLNIFVVNIIKSSKFK